MSTPLRDGVSRLDLTMRLTLGVLALASGVYTYLGVRQLLDGSAGMVFFAALVYSTAVSVGIYAFWSFLLRFVPHVRDHASRAMLVFAMLLGSAMIVAMSSWLNAAALAGSAALEQHLATKLESYTRDLDRAHSNALSAQSLLPDIQMASVRFQRLAEAEREGGTLTGSSGSGTVVQLLAQMSGQLDGLATEVRASGERVERLFEQGGGHLERMRELVSGRGAINPRSDAFATEAVALMGVIASLQQTSVAPAVKRAAEDLSIGFIAPVADGRSADLAQRQTTVVGNVESAVAAQSAALSQAADEILAVAPVEPERFEALSTAEAVLRYATDFLPSWAGAISIDLLPAVLVIILSVVHAGIRREGAPVVDASTMTAADLITAMRLVREMEGERVPPSPPEPDPEPGAEEDGPAPAPAEERTEHNVTPLPPSRAGKKE